MLVVGGGRTIGGRMATRGGGQDLSGKFSRKKSATWKVFAFSTSNVDIEPLWITILPFRFRICQTVPLFPKSPNHADCNMEAIINYHQNINTSFTEHNSQSKTKRLTSQEYIYRRCCCTGLAIVIFQYQNIYIVLQSKGRPRPCKYFVEELVQ